jgi:hypothetical protein
MLPGFVKDTLGGGNEGTQASASEDDQGLERSTSEGNQAIQGSANDSNNGIAIAATVPDVVQESITESHQSPEAAASTDVVEEKKAVESELLEHVKPVEAMGEPAPSASVALSEKAPVPTSTAQATDDITDVGTNDIAAPDPTSKVPVKRAMAEAIQTRHDSGDISPLSYPVKGIPEGPDVVYNLGTETYSPAVHPAASQTVPQTVPHGFNPPVSEKVTESVPQTAQPTVPQPVSERVPQAVHPTNPQIGSSVTTSVPTSSTPQKSRAEAIPASSTKSTHAASEASASSDKKSKRASGFFGKLKQKFSHKE